MNEKSIEHSKNPGPRSKRLVAAVLLTLATVGLGAAVQAQTVGPTQAVSRFNSGGTSFLTIAPVAGRACYLTRVDHEDTDSGNESAGCRVRRSNGNIAWLLEATLGQNDDADIRCEAICITF
jgi:hypothetical protein